MINYMSQKFSKTLGLIAFTGLSFILDAQPLPVAPTDINWSLAGPIYTSGRSRNIVVDKTDASGKTLYTGSASSGVFFTTNGGLSWKPLQDQGSIRNISYMAQSIDNTIYASTGEGFLRPGQLLKAQKGTGLYKVNLSTKQLDLVKGSNAVGTIINRIACSPVNANIIAVAGNGGILISTDGGNNFSPAQGVVTGGLFSGQDVEFDGAGRLYCTIGNEQAVTGSPSSRIYRADDANLSNTTNFTAITPTSAVLGAPNYGRIELAIAPSNNQVIYASVANKYNSRDGKSSTLRGLFVSYDSGVNWGLILQGSSQLDPLSDGSRIASGDYAHTILVNPVNSDEIFVGGYLFYTFKRTSGSNSNPIGTWISLGTPFLQNFPFYLHENIHDIKIVGPSSAPIFYIVTDAGIYRSIDQLLSFQPFYKGLVTGQFNSVSIEAFPSSANAANASPGEPIKSVNGFIGGTGGNGLTYYSGVDTVVSQEISYLSGEVYNAEFSKLLPHAAFFTTGAGTLYRISDVRTSSPEVVNVNSYSGTLAKITPATSDFANEAFVNETGSPFKLWENYGNKVSPDSIVFYNDSLTIQTSFLNVPQLNTQSTFTFSSGRPNKFALIDSIAIRTGTVIFEATKQNLPTPFVGADRKDIFVKLANGYTASPTGVTIPSVSLRTGPVAAAGVTLNATTGLDDISVTFTSPPFANKTIASYQGFPDPSVFYKVFATIFYKYKVGDTVLITDNSVSTKSTKYAVPLKQPLRWSQSGNKGPKPFSAPTNPIVKIAPNFSARLAVVYRSNNITGASINLPAVLVSKAPLSLNDPLSFVRVSQSGALTTDANGVPTNNPITITGKPNLIEWSKSGTELYYATDDFMLYRVSNIGTLLDLTPSSYSGKISTDIFKYSSNATGAATINPDSPYRTTLLGTFTKPITSISISADDANMALTFNDPGGVVVMYNTNSIKKSDFTNIGFTSKTGLLGSENIVTYCSLMEKDDSKKVFVGTDKGIYYTNDITATSPSWTNVNNGKLPSVQIFDIKQQTLERWNCYNSGEIYVATNGRGIWKNKNFFSANLSSLSDLSAGVQTENDLKLYPNPASGDVFVRFNSAENESSTLNLMDINGRIVKSENLGKLYPGEVTYGFDTRDLSAGMYIVSINGTSGTKRIAKLVVTK